MNKKNVISVIPSEDAANDQRARFWRAGCRVRAEGPGVFRSTRSVPGPKRKVLRLRARPTRKGSGSEIQGGRFAQDDTLGVMNNPDSGLRKAS